MSVYRYVIGMPSEDGNIQFDAEGGMRIRGRNGYVDIRPADVPKLVHSMADLARWHDGWGHVFPKGLDRNEIVEEACKIKPAWSVFDVGNLARIAEATEATRNTNREIMRAVVKIGKLSARMERVLKLFEKVLEPWAEKVANGQADKESG